LVWIAGVFCAVGIGASQASAGPPGGYPGCTSENNPVIMEIEVNALRVGGKTIVTSPNDTTKVTAKARILKGTAVKGTTISTTLTVQVLDGDVVIGQGVHAPITLGVGKGGKGATLTVLTQQCDSGWLTFAAEFRGVDVDGETCTGTDELRKPCK
jgi:hypothetical protein